MKIERLLCFQAVSQYRSFSKAADNLYISQSSLSKNIKALEGELGGALFIRKSNNVVTLSPFGEFISNEINNIIQDYNILMAAADSYKINHAKKLTVATFLNIAHSGILRPLTEFEAAQDNFFIETIEAEHSSLRLELAMHHVDICFGYKELIGEAQDYTIFPLFQDPLTLVTTKKQAVAQGWKGKLNLSDLRSVAFCFPREDVELFTFLNNVCRANDFTPQLTHSNVRLGTIRQYISVGLRCTLQFDSISHSKFYDSKFEFFELKNAPFLTFSMYVENQHKKKMKTKLVDHILKWCEENNYSVNQELEQTCMDSEDDCK